MALNTPLTFFLNTTIVRNDFELVTVGAGVKIILVSFSINVSAATTPDILLSIGFGASSIDTEVGGHPKVTPGGGIYPQRGTKKFPIAVGAAGEDLRFTCAVPTDGAVDVYGSYFEDS